jgi:hypothetical protein
VKDLLDKTSVFVMGRSFASLRMTGFASFLKNPSVVNLKAK